MPYADPAKRAEQVRRWPIENRERSNAFKRAWRERNPEKVKAASAVSNAVRDGHLAKGPCEVCGAERVQAHHDDYTKPLEVRWLCPTHHKRLHRF